mgnify:CR=1 FL=1
MGVSIIGWAHSPFGRLDDMDLEALIAGVSRDALRHAEVAARDVDGIWLGQLNGGFVPDIFCSSLVLQADPELRWCPATRVENACASGAAAVEYTDVLRGRKDFVIYYRLLPWDHGTPALILTEAGGMVVHMDGAPYTIASPNQVTVVARSGPVQAQVRACLGGAA